MSQQPFNKQALRIYKGKKGSGLDEYPLIAIGAIPVTFQAIVPSLVSEPEVRLLIHAQEYTQYLYFVNMGDATDGFVLISLFVPADMRFTADCSPYDFLKKVFESFKTQYNTSRIDIIQFEQLLTQCTLEERPDEIRLPIMNGSNPASYCADSRAQVSALLRFSHYPQLSNISHLEIGCQCNSTITLPIKARKKPDTLQEQKPNSGMQQKTGIRRDIKQKPNIDTGKQSSKKNHQKGYINFFIVVLVLIGLSLAGNAWFDTSKSEQDSPIVNEVPTLTIQNEDQFEDTVIVERMNRKAERAAAEKAAAKQAAAEKAAAVAATKAEILQLVNERDLPACRNHKGWEKHLTNKERLAVEAVFNMEQFKGRARKKIENLLEGKSFNSWDELLKMKITIGAIQSNEKNDEK